MENKILITYYTWSGNTKAIAETIQSKTQGRIFELNPIHAYSRNYKACLDQAKKEIKSGSAPSLETIPENFEKYDVIFIGSPIWWGTMAPPVLSFLKQADLNSKKVVPFCTHGGGGQGHFTADVTKMCKNSSVLPGIALFGNGGSSKDLDISAWLDNLTL